MRGIDVSHNNGVIDWEKVKDNIDFAILKIGWIGNKQNHTIDNQFERNYSECKRLGIKIGLYVFNYCNSENTVVEGANWVLERIKDKTFEYPVYIDMENAEGSTLSELGKDVLTNIANKFCEHLTNNNVKTGVYANLDWFKNYLDINTLNKYSIWLAEWNNKENHSADFKVDIWQYTSSGSVNGITGNVDMNNMYNVENVENTVDNVENSVDNSVNAGQYIVKSGDTLTSIAKIYGISWQTLYANNKDVIGSNPNLIKPGQVLNINAGSNPETATSYTVKRGDNLTKIGKKFGLSWKVIYENNKDIIGSNPNIIKVGMVLKIR